MAKYCALVSCRVKKTLILSLIFNRQFETHVSAKFYQAKCSGSWVIVATEKRRKTSLPRAVTSGNNRDVWRDDRTSVSVIWLKIMLIWSVVSCIGWPVGSPLYRVTYRCVLLAGAPAVFMHRFLWNKGDTPSPLSLIHIWRCRRSYACRSRWSPYH